MNIDEDFFIVLTSNSSKKQYTNNKTCAFTCHIPASYNLEGRWEVCLWSLCATSKVVQDDLLEDPPGSILVYTDIVTDTVIGDTTASLLAYYLCRLNKHLLNLLHFNSHITELRSNNLRTFQSS